MLVLPRTKFSTLGGRSSWRRSHPQAYWSTMVGSIIGAAALIFLIFRAFAGTGADYLVTPDVSPTTGGEWIELIVDPNSPYGGWTGDYFFDFPFPREGQVGNGIGLEEQFVIPVDGDYKLEVWGAQGSDNGTTLGGRGGYATANVYLTKGTTVYISAGGRGYATSGAVGGGGWNGGGGAQQTAIAGGGASHMALRSGTLDTLNSYRNQILIVAGGGGGAGVTGGAQTGGAGGGLTGINGLPASGNPNGGGGGSQTAGGAAGGGNSGQTAQSVGTFGVGGQSRNAGGSNYGGTGGGGLFGGGGTSGAGGGGGGGSCYYPGSSSAVTGTLPQLSVGANASTPYCTAGNASMPDPESSSGGTMTGKSGDGWARFTLLMNGVYDIPGFPPMVYVDGVAVGKNNIQVIQTDPLANEPGRILFRAPAHAAGDAEITVSIDPSLSGTLHYYAPADGYTNQCQNPANSQWVDTSFNIKAGNGVGGGVNCRIVINNAFSGTLELSDDLYDTIDPSLGGTFTSADSRFDGTNTFTVDYTDTYSSSGRTLYYTYYSPSWGDLINWWDEEVQDDLFWPALEVTPTPASSSIPDIVLGGNQIFFGVLAEAYTISSSSSSSTLCQGCNTAFTISTYGAPYLGTITVSEDLTYADDNAAGTFTYGGVTGPTAVISFAGQNGSSLDFRYTPNSPAVSPSYIDICGVSASPNIDDPVAGKTCLPVNVVPNTMSITGPDLLSRGQPGTYTLTVFSTAIDLVTLTNLLAATNNSAGGSFIDTTASPYNSTFNSGTSTYDFSSCTTISDPTNPPAACIRTFTYTTSPSLADNASYIHLRGTADTADFTFINVYIIASQLGFTCGASSPNCTIAYVGEPQDYNVRPNGTFTGSAVISSNDPLGSFSLGNTASWNDEANFVGISYTPGAPGRYKLAAASTSADPVMDNKTFYSCNEDLDGLSCSGGIGNYLWVMANETTFFAGDPFISHGGTGTYTIALNGPFVGTVLLSNTDSSSGLSANGTWPSGDSCNFTLASYDIETGTSSCTFTYRPVPMPQGRTIRLAPVLPPEYTRWMDIGYIDVTVSGEPTITAIASTPYGPSTGGDTVWFSGVNLSGATKITFDDIPCLNLFIEPNSLARCNAPAHPAGVVEILVNDIIPMIPELDPFGDPVLDPYGDPVMIPAPPIEYTYFQVADEYINECTLDGGTTWETGGDYLFVDAGEIVHCRIVLNGRWHGRVFLSDDYYDTISPTLSGAFASDGTRTLYSDSAGTYFELGYSDTIDPADQILEYTYTSPDWSTLMPEWDEDNGNDLWWPLLEISIPTTSGQFLPSPEDDIVFGLIAQEYFIKPYGKFDAYCVGCSTPFYASTYGAPYFGTITITEDLSNSDNPSGAAGVFTYGSTTGSSITIDFSDSEGANANFNYTPNTPATSPAYIDMCGASASPATDIAEDGAWNCYQITPVIDAGITITPADSYSSMLLRGGTGTYTLTITKIPSWTGAVTLSDVFAIDGVTPGSGSFYYSPSGPCSFNSSTNTFAFTGTEPFTCTFSYTLRNDNAPGGGPAFPGYTMQLTATDGTDTAFTNIGIIADRLMIKCASNSPDCATSYVGKSSDYAIVPNGWMTGTAAITSDDIGSLAAASFSGTAPYTLSYVPSAPGRYTITATVTSDSLNSALVSQSFVSTSADSLDDYIYVMANDMWIEGPDRLKYNTVGYFTLVMNGPYDGAIDLDDWASDLSPGTFPVGATCTFNPDDYDPSTNPNGYNPITGQSTCVFSYKPVLDNEMFTAKLTPWPDNPVRPVSGTPLSFIVYGRPIIEGIDPEFGPTAGGNTVIMTGTGLAPGGSSFGFDELIFGDVYIPLSHITISDVDTISISAPTHAAGLIDIVVIAGASTFHHPDIYTYIPQFTSLLPDIGPTTGGLGFGPECANPGDPNCHDPDGAVTITGTHITPAAHYSDGTDFYLGLDYLNFTGSQYINTGVNATGNISVTLDATRSAGQYAAGVMIAGDYFAITLPTDGSSPTAYYGGGANYYASTGAAMSTTGDRIQATLSANGTDATLTTTLNGQTNDNQIIPTAQPNPGNNYPIFLGGADNGAGTAGYLTGRVYSFTISKGGTVDDRNFVPVCTEDGTKGGMFDTIHNVFYPSSTATPFTCNLSNVTPPTVIFGGTIVPGPNSPLDDTVQGGATATTVRVTGINTIEAVPPAHAAGLVDVYIIINGYISTMADAYTYRSPLTILSINPPSGAITGGDPITIYGDSFIPLGWPSLTPVPITVTMDIDGTPAYCASPTVIDDQTITCTTPAHATGLVSVTVDNTVESFTMVTALDSSGSGLPTLNSNGYSTGGFLYLEPTALSLALSTTSVDLSVTLSVPYDEDNILVSVSTTALSGYKLYMASAGTDLICTSNTSLPSIPSTTPGAIASGSWGYQVGTSVSPIGWSAVPTSSSQIDASSSPTYLPPSPTASRDTTVNFAVRNGTTTPISTACPLYTQTLTYTAIANP